MRSSQQNLFPTLWQHKPTMLFFFLSLMGLSHWQIFATAQHTHLQHTNCPSLKTRPPQAVPLCQGHHPPNEEGTSTWHVRLWRAFQEHIPPRRWVPTTSLGLLRPKITSPGHTWETQWCLMTKTKGPTHISSLGTQTDRSWKVSTETPPLSTDAHLFLFKNQLSKLMFDESTHPPKTHGDQRKKNKIQLCISLPVFSDLAHNKKRCACLEKFWTSIVHILAEHPGLNPI